MERMSESFSVRVTPSQKAKADNLALRLGIKRNQVIGRLLNNAQVVSEPQVEVMIMASPVAPAEEKANVH